MFGKRPTGSTYYYGSESHRYIDELIGSPGEVLIVSPYIDAHYASCLTKRYGNKEFYIISSKDGAAPSLLKVKNGKVWILAYGSLSAILLSISILIGLRGVFVLPSLVPILVGMMRNWPRRPNVSVKMPKKFVHAKMYISDSMAITGSANLTYAGTHKNIEHLDITYDQNDIDRLKDQFWSMWNDL